MDRLEEALADEVLAEVKRQRYTHKEMQTLSGVKQRVWGHYFVQRDRDIPFHALRAVCTVLNVKPSEMIRRAERSVSQAPATDLAEHITRQLSPEAQDQVRRARAEKEAEEEAGENPA